jgi:hypothetical protein
LTGSSIASTGRSNAVPGSAHARLAVVLVFVVLLIGFAVGIWGTLLRPAAYEVRGTLVARPAANLLLVRHDDIAALGMRAMDLMAIFGDPVLVDRAGVVPGQRVRLGVRARDDELTLLWIEALR